MGWTGRFSRILTTALVLGAASSAVAAEDGVWSVRKSSGEVWMSTTGTQQVSLRQEETLKPGDTIRTGRNGRVLVVRGEETILVSPNSVIGLPSEKKEGLSTTIVQQAGSILLEVEKRNVKHFEVETPYLAAVVKGTHFSITVNAASTSVHVLRGQVEVADFKSGQIAQVMPGQVATAFAHGKAGLSLTGLGTFNPIEQGKPRASSIKLITVPKAGLALPGSAVLRPGVTRISASLGEVRLNFQKVTHGLAHGSTPGPTRSAANKDTVWSLSEGKATMGMGTGNGNANDAGGSAASTSAAANSGVTAAVAAVTGAAINAGIGNGNASANGNAHANANGLANGNGHAHVP
jgi:hypothetical protein